MNTLKAYLNRLGSANTVLAVIILANSSAGRGVIKKLVRFLYELYGPLAPHLPIRAISFDSPAHVDTEPGDVSAADGSTPLADFRNYKDYTVGEISDRAMERSTTEYIARRMEHLQRTMSSAHGCSQDVNFGYGCFIASVPEREALWRNAILATKDEARLAACERAGVRVLSSRRVVVFDTENLPGSTGRSGFIPNLVLGHHIARQVGTELAPYLLPLTASASVSGSPATMRHNCASGVLEAGFAASPSADQCVLHTFDGRTISYQNGPIIDGFIPSAISSEYQAAASREQLEWRLAFQLAVLICTPAFQEIQKLVTDARRKNTLHAEHGFPFIWRLGLSRRFCSAELNGAIFRDEARRHLLQTI